jgi:putative tryptophan/tyrosine transport system substrate-binding protein
MISLLHDLLPEAMRFAALVNPANPTMADTVAKDAQQAAAAIGRQVAVFSARTRDEVDSAFADFAQQRIDAVMVAPDVLFFNRRVQLVTFATRRGLPAIYSGRDYPLAGGLMSYGANLMEQFRQAGVYVGRLLKGEKAAELPIMRPTKFEFVINLHTAKAFGLSVPPSLLAIADEVIE